METYHRLARSLGVTTGRLVSGERIGKQRHGDDNKVSLLAMRRAITPPIGIDGFVKTLEEEPDLIDLKSTAVEFVSSYQADKYQNMAALIPSLVTSAHAAVTHYVHTPNRTRLISYVLRFSSSLDVTSRRFERMTSPRQLSQMLSAMQSLSMTD